MVDKSTWDCIKQQLAAELPREAFDNWVARTECTRAEDNTLHVKVSDEHSKLWLERELASRISDAMNCLQLPAMKICYHLSDDQQSGGAAAGAAGAGSRSMTASVPFSAADPFPDPETQLNARFTFGSFVVGSCNQLAHAAACAVAGNPAKRYNPLFIYGGSGMGKTHLLHAIGRFLLDNKPGMRVAVTNGERFMNDMIHCLRTDHMSSFQQHYRSADALLVDDVHILAGKERTQEEFFHTFNSLYDHEKQIVISSDQIPKEMPGLVDRLRTRFEWGLMVDVQPPDLETKMAILDKKASTEGIDLPDEVRIFIATKTKSSVRELEGVLTRLVAYSSVTGAPITLAMAQQALRQILHTPEKRITVDTVLRTVAERFSLQPAQLKQKTNVHEISRPRQIAMYISKELTGASLPEIGRHFGGKHHTTVLHALRKIEQLRQTDPDVNRLVHSVLDSFQ